MKKHLCRTLMALGLTLAAVGAGLPTAWADEPNPPLDCAAALLMDLLNDPHTVPRSQMLGYELVCRESTGD